MIKIICDSTGYLPPNLVEQYDITVVPLKVQFGHDSFDETALDNRVLYQRLQSENIFPTTSQPTIGEFQAAFEQARVANSECEILVLTISSLLSGTYHSAESAAQQFPQAQITLFDSRSAAMGLGLMTLTAAQMAEAGASRAEIVVRLSQMRADTRILLVIDTLEYLRRGGRIGAARAFLGTLLNTKPILTLTAGQLQPFDRVRSKRKALNRLLEGLETAISPEQPVYAGVMHVSAPNEVEELVTALQNRFNIITLYTSELGAVISAHLGPGALGVGLCPVSTTDI